MSQEISLSTKFSGDFKAEAGALSGTCHKPPQPEKVEVVTEAYRLTAYANPLNPDAFPGIRKMEAEVVRMALNLFHGDGESCGTVIVTPAHLPNIVIIIVSADDFRRNGKSDFGVQGLQEFCEGGERH